MIPRDILSLATRKLRRRWFRSAIAILTIAIGVAPPVLLASLWEGIHEALASSADTFNLPRDLLIASKTDNDNPASGGITETDLAAIRAIPGVVSADETPRADNAYLRIVGDEPIVNPSSFPSALLQRFAAAPAAPNDDRIPLVVGRLLLQYHYDYTENEYVRLNDAPESYIGREFDVVVGDPVGVQWNLIYDYRLKKQRVVTEAEKALRIAQRRAVLNTQYDLEKLGSGQIVRARVAGLVSGYGVYLPAETVKAWNAEIAGRKKLALRPGMDDPNDTYNTQQRGAIVQVRPDADALQVTHAVEACGFSCYGYASNLDRELKQMTAAVAIVKWIALAIVIFGGLTIATTVSRAIVDATRDIGLYRALGATKTQLQAVFICQGAVLGLVGGLLGAILGNGLALWISRWALSGAGNLQQSARIFGQQINVQVADIMPPTFYHFAPLHCAACLAIAVVVAIAATLIPSWQAARMDPIAALRRE